MYSKVYSTVQYTVLSTDLVALLAVQTQGTDSTDQVVFHLSYWQATALVLLLLLLLLFLLLPVSRAESSLLLSRLVIVTDSGVAKLAVMCVRGIGVSICICK